MAITPDALRIEIGSDAYGDLTSDEVNAICLKYSPGEERLAGMKAFELLSKKFKPSYRMGRMYEEQSQKYEHYNRIYARYASGVSAGYSPSGLTGDDQLSRDKWIE